MIFNVNAAKSPFSLPINGSTGTFVLPLEDIDVYVDSTAGPVSIYIPTTASFIFQGVQYTNVRIFIQDVAGNAGTNAITVFTSGSDIINNSASFAINTSHGFARIKMGSAGIWTVTNSVTTSGTGLLAANNGLSVSGGTTAQLGGALIKPTVIPGLASGNYVSWQDIAGSSPNSQLAFGDISSLSGGSTYGTNSLIALTSVANEVWGLAVNNKGASSVAALINIDSTNNITRSIGVNPPGSGGFANGGASITESYPSSIGYGLSVHDRSVVIFRQDTTLAVNHTITGQIQLSDNFITCAQYITLNNSASLVSGWQVGNGSGITDAMALKWHCSQNSPDGTILQLDVNGLSFKVSNTLQFLISPTGRITTSGMPTSDPHVAGVLYTNGAAPAPVFVSGG